MADIACNLDELNVAHGLSWIQLRHQGIRYLAGSTAKSCIIVLQKSHRTCNSLTEQAQYDCGEQCSGVTTTVCCKSARIFLIIPAGPTSV